MTKVAIVHKMFAKGVTSATVIARRTGIRRGYVHNILWKLRDPEQARATSLKWRKSLPRHRQRSMRRRLPSFGKAQLRNAKRHQRETLETASRSREPWTDRDLAYLETHGKSDTIHEMAVALGRTYLAILRKACRCRISLGHEEKTGLNAIQFMKHTGA